MSRSAQITASPNGDWLKEAPILGILFILSFVNWFLFAAINIYLGGDALGTLPSRDGFVVTSHGHHKAVSESAWIFSLFYSGATVLLTPLIWLSFAVRHFGRHLKRARWHTRLLIFGFIFVWCVGWYSSIGSSMRRSIDDWQKLKHPRRSVRALELLPIIYGTTHGT